MMHGHEKSDLAIVALKPANNAEQSAAELAERRTGTKGNADQQSTHWTQSQARVSQALDRIRQIFAVTHRGGSRMRESRPYGSVRGARDETRVPTATTTRVHHARWGGGRVSLAAYAQQPAMPMVGFLQSASPGATAHMLAAFHSGLTEVGYRSYSAHKESPGRAGA